MNQSISLWEEERSETLEGVQVLKINSIQENLATQVEDNSQVKSRGSRWRGLVIVIQP